MINVLKDMLLIEEHNVFRLYKELMSICQYFIAPVFTIALVLEYFSEMNFGVVIKKLLLIVIFMSSFYSFHTSATKLALDSASKTLKRVSPSNVFVKKWFQVKIRTKKKSGWNRLKQVLIPNVNDFVATSFFVLGKIFLWLLKLIYSSVYHLTYIFAGVTAILYFLGWTKDALKGTVQASLWCMVMPFVIVAILALVGNSIDKSAANGELIIAKIDTIIWLFGVTLLLLISPLISYGMIKGDGIHSFGSKMGSMVVSSGLKATAIYPMMSKMMNYAAVKSGFKSNNNFRKSNVNNSKSNVDKKTNSKAQSNNKKNVNKHGDKKAFKTNLSKSLRTDNKANVNKSSNKDVRQSNKASSLKPSSKAKPQNNIIKSNNIKSASKDKVRIIKNKDSLRNTRTTQNEENVNKQSSHIPNRKPKIRRKNERL
ncbi:MAG: hypothetical protein N4A33_02960 [Bacteriovoracaceae bacterium]|jgi:hypothetical protein|nr:hypothetical protein [Bacteriovoracaceae bacterium]